MYCLFSKFTARSGKRDELLTLIADNSSGMTGCLSYLVHTSPHDPDGIYVYESWADQAAHDAAVNVPSVQAAIQQAIPLLAALPEQTVLERIPENAAGQ